MLGLDEALTYELTATQVGHVGNLVWEKSCCWNFCADLESGPRLPDCYSLLLGRIFGSCFNGKTKASNHILQTHICLCAGANLKRQFPLRWSFRCGVTWRYNLVWFFGRTPRCRYAQNKDQQKQKCFWSADLIKNSCILDHSINLHLQSFNHHNGFKFVCFSSNKMSQTIKQILTSETTLITP